MFADGVCGIDIDNVKGNPERERMANEIITLMDTYTETSPSGNGYHIIFRGDLLKIPKQGVKLDPAYYQKNPHNGVECYISGLTNRYFTYTGNPINDREVEDRTERFLIFLNRYMRKPNPPASATNVSGGFKKAYVPTAHDIISIAQKAKNGKSFTALFKDGDTSKYNGDDSSADMALCCYITFYSGNNPDLIDEIFRKSALYRDKWEREDYRTRTIETAITHQNGVFYKWTRPKKPRNQIQSVKSTLHLGAVYFNPFESLESRSRYTLNDRGAGYFFADVYKNISRFVREANMWYVYDGRVWKPDIGGMKVAQQAKDLIDYMLDCRKYIINDNQFEVAWVKFASRLMDKKPRDIMLKDAESVFPVSIDEFDKVPYLLNVQNGVLNLQTLTLHPHNPNDLMSKIANVTYNPTARCERWELFIQQIMQDDMDKARFLQKALGYALTGDTSEECFFILYGATTRNGKGTTAETILYLMGDYGCTAQPETIAQMQTANGSAPSEDVARLKGARFVNMSEPDKGLRLNSARVKQMTGGDTITARFLHQNSFEYKPEFKLFINTNHLPRISDDSIFASGRVKIIPFEKHFTENEQDKGLKELFRQPQNLSGILNWLIGGVKLLREEGLEQPQAVNDAIKEYRDESETLSAFISECLTPDKAKNIPMKSVYEVYGHWCKGNGYSPLNNRNLTAELRKKRLTIKPSTGNLNYLFGYDTYGDYDCGACAEAAETTNEQWGEFESEYGISTLTSHTQEDLNYDEFDI